MAGELRQVAAAAQEFPTEFVEEAADEIAEEATERLEQDTGGDLSLSHAPAELSVNVKISGGGSSATAEVTAEGGGGQWAWMEEGTLPHQVRGFLHPGTAGRGTWSDPVSRALRRLPFKAREAVGRIMEG